MSHSSKMPSVNPDPLPRDWNYSLERDFTKDGIAASWADGNPVHWDNDGSVIPVIAVHGHITAAALSLDEKYLAIGFNNVTSIYSVDDLSLRGSVTESAEDAIARIQWQPARDAETGYGLLVAVKSRSETTKSRLIVRELDHTGHWQDKENGFQLVLQGGFGFGFGSIAFSHSGRCLLVPTAGGSNGGQSDEIRSYNIDVWDISSNEAYLQLIGHEDRIVWAGYSLDDKVIATSSWDQTLKLWNAETGALIHSLGPSGGQNWTAAFSPDGQLIALGCGNPTASLIVWNIKTGEQILSTAGSPAWTRTIAWSPRSSWLALGAQSGAVRVQDVTTGIIAQDWRLKYEGIKNTVLTEIKGINWFDDGKKIYFSTGMDCGVEVYDLEENLKWRFAPSKERIRSLLESGKLTVSPIWCDTKRQMLCFGPDKTVRFWNL